MAEFILSALIRAYGYIFDIFRFAAPLLSRMRFAANWDLADRLSGPHPSRAPNGKVFWIHGASMGEAKLAVTFLSIVLRKHPEAQFLLTATSRTGVQYLADHAPGAAVIATGFMPPDAPVLIERTLERFNVQRVWLMETEIWPGLIWTCRKQHIPVGIANARIEEDSFQRFQRFRSVLSPLFEYLDPVMAQNEMYARRFELLGTRSESLHIVRNIKSHIPIARPNIDEWRSIRERLLLKPDDFVITAGCLHPGEGAAIRTAVDALECKGVDAKWIIVPRHLRAVDGLLEELGNTTLRLTEPSSSTPWRICLVEKMGILEDMYKISDAAFLGGTFVDVGGHNVWEAARYGVPVFFGPDYHTQLESCKRLIEAGVGFETRDGDDLAQRMVSVTRLNARAFIEAQQKFIATINSSQSALELHIP